MIRSSLIVSSLCVFVVGCSEAETPISGFTGGAVADGGPTADSGPSTGGVNEPCGDDGCDDTDLVCVDASPADICRALCDQDDTTDPCGPGFTCDGLVGGDGACLPASQVDGPCPCDEGFECTTVNTDGGTTNLCKHACDPSADPGDAGVPDGGFDGQGCPAGTTCRPFLIGGTPSTTEGACLPQ